MTGLMMSYNLSNLKSSLLCISSTATQEKKNEALHYLEQFQKSPQAWPICYEVLMTIDPTELELQIFSAQTLRNKVTYDLSQLDGGLAQLKDSLLKFLLIHNQNVVLTQLNVALARLAIQYLEWKNPIMEIISTLNPYPSKLLRFLRILPEETLDIGSTPLTEDEFNSRTHELINTIAEDVLKFLISCIDILQSQEHTNTDITLENIMRCLGSWSFEFPVDQLLTVKPLIALIFESLLRGVDSEPGVFDAAIDCLSVILRESRDAPNEQLVLSLLQDLISLQTKLLPSLLSFQSEDEDEQDEELMEGLTRLFVEAGEAWCVFISKSPEVYQPIVSILLMLTCKNTDLDLVAYSFPFWFNLKQNLVLPRYKNSRELYIPTFINLINGIIKHLQYPSDGFSTKEAEDKFKDFRYHMGDVLKDCAAVVGTSNALSQPLTKIKEGLNINGSWQQLEAPLFSLRTMAQEISHIENAQLPQILNIVCNLPEHPKLRYASTLVLGRYTEWTAKHPELLEMQLQYIFDGFSHGNGNSEIMTASAHALMFFCTDCSELLSTHIEQLIDFYFKVEAVMDIESQFELCQGLSAVINKQPNDIVASVLQKLLDDNLSRISDLIPKWKSSPSSFSLQIADKIDLIYALFEELRPRFEIPQQGSEPLVPQIEYIWNTLNSLLVNFGAMTEPIIVERSSKLLRRFFDNFHLFCEPILAPVAELLAQGYAATGLGSYLWCSGSIIVVFGDDESLPVPSHLKGAVWQFATTQCKTFIEAFNKIDLTHLNDYYELIMDFFTMVTDLVMFYPREFILSGQQLGEVVDVALKSLIRLENFDAYMLILRSLDDIISWGFKTPPISTVSLVEVPDDWRVQIMREVIVARGAQLISCLFIALVTNLHMNAHSEAVTCIVKCLKLAFEANNNDPKICIQWICQSVDQLDQVTTKEKDNLSGNIMNGLNREDSRKMREGIKAFIEWYLRKNVNPRCY
ncbi:hypothetical protein HG535_0D04700 [Zygotorulaspora mrakii]|uniref:Importin N-terminal domain-containing protein n=1 Tax=Zygotorulaspora mrakii TaxID=42260 RepID=A0A7H9B282_ZYGMR|nr:uncharacterized protein HG535_0D04700 [Zygotorulaspora mrakii]QLG72761.1 hypothetical protein HG535_0D04700 [Zygotorulaspora mrakii]